MESDSWIVQILQNALNILNEKITEIWQLLTMSPADFKDGAIWKVIVDVHGALLAIGLALLVLFFLFGVIKTCGSFAEVKKPEHAVKMFVRFAIAKAVVTYGMDIMLAIFDIFQGAITTIMKSSGLAGASESSLPVEMIKSIEKIGFLEKIPLWAVSIIGSLIITVLSLIMIMTIYGRFFKLYLYTGISPIPMSTFAGEPTSSIGVTFIKSYASVCLEGAIIVLACIIFNVFASTPPTISSDVSTINQVWSYITQLVFNVLILVGTVKASDRIVKEMMGL